MMSEVIDNCSKVRHQDGRYGTVIGGRFTLPIEDVINHSVRIVPHFVVKFDKDSNLEAVAANRLKLVEEDGYDQ